MLFNRLLKNKKGTAEVIGSVMFIVILLFFFTNVYLWHDAATKEMNQMYVDRINTPITANVHDQTHLNVTNKGGADTTLSMVWMVGPDQIHDSTPNNEIVLAGKSILVQIPEKWVPISPGTLYKVVTTNGNTASCSFP